MSRIGVFICYCGSNIAGTVDVEAVAEMARTLPDVVHVETNKYTGSDPGQEGVRQAIIDRGIDRVVVAACSPRMHEPTWRKLLADTPVNPYMLEVANIREQCSWVHKDRDIATEKAKDLVKMAVAKVARLQPLHSTEIPVHKKALVIGGGIAGMQTALDIADAGFKVTIVERETSLGGKMVMLDKTFPTMDCSACICTPKMSEVGNHPNITVKSYSEVENVSGYIGNFEVTIREKAKYIDYSKCTGCGACETKCPSKVTNDFEQGMAKRTAIYKMFPQAVPSKPVIDAAHCRMLTEGKCGVCAKVCPTGATYKDDQGRVEIDYDKCIGCRMCMAACPYNVRQFNWEEPVRDPDFNYGDARVPVRVKGVMEKCTLCKERTDDGDEPMCVVCCPMRARKFGDLDDPNSEISRIRRERNVRILLEDMGTKPQVFYFA